MRAKSLQAAGFGRRIVLFGLLLAISPVGCGDTSREGRAGLKVVVGDEWTHLSPTDVVVPGTVVSAWTGPEGASLVAFTSLPIPEPNPEALGRELAVRWLNLPGVTVEGSSVQTYSGQKAARVEAVGPGTGSALAPSGVGTPIAPEGKSLIATRRISVSFARKGDTLTLIWHFPESARAAIEPKVESILRSIEVADVVGPTYSY